MSDERIDTVLEKLAFTVNKLESAVFNESGTNRITEETARFNRLRMIFHEWKIGIDRAIGGLGLSADRDRSEVERISENFTQRFDQLVERIQRLEKQTEFETSEDDAGILGLRRRVGQLNETVAHLSKKMENMVLPDEVEPEYSPPIGGVVSSGRPVFAESTMRAVSGAVAMQKEAYERGLSAGTRNAIENAERRIRGLMEGSFSTATTEEIIQALRQAGNSDISD